MSVTNILELECFARGCNNKIMGGVIVSTLISILDMRNYGTIKFKFKEIMDSRNITRGRLSALANIRFEVADRFYNGEIERMDINVLTRICYVLDCNVNDVIEYERCYN